jgi:Tfp pilus assembly protein PilF
MASRQTRVRRFPRRWLPVGGVCLLAALSTVGGAQDSAPKPPPPREDAYRANNLGVAHLEQYNYEQAATSFRRALEIDSGLTLARVNLAIALLYVPDLAGAEREARTALEQQPGSLQAHYVLGLVARAENRPDDGIAAFKRVLASDPRDIGALVNLGQLLMQRREYVEAAALFRTAVEAESYHVTATYNLAVALSRSGKTDEGQQMTAQFQKLRESGYGTTFSNNYLEQGRYAEALVSTGAEPELVNEATPNVRFVETRIIAPPSAPDPAQTRDPRITVAATGMSGGVTLVDVDRDDDLDLVDVSTGMVRLFANQDGQLTDVTAKIGLPAPVLPASIAAAADASQPASGGVALGVIAGDYDNDERPDLFVVGFGRHWLYRQTDDGRFDDRTSAAKIPPADPLRWAAAFADVDHDGDLDLFLAGTRRFSREDALRALNQGAKAGEWGPAPNQLLRNNGDGTFADITAEAKVAEPLMQGAGIAPIDFDNRRDLDLVVVGIGHGPVLFRNMRDGAFLDVAKDAGLP